MADKKIVKKLEAIALDIKMNLLELSNQTLIHIGGDMSICDMMTAIWHYAMKYDSSNPAWEDRDRFVLSKGHAAAVTSYCQAALGCYQPEEINKEYATDYGRFGMHSCNLINPYVEVSTGSLGHGLPVAGGIAAALKAKKSGSRVFVGIGDGELGEGSIWEAIMSSHQYKLGNLIAFMDRNKLSFDGPTEELMALEPVGDKFRAFGWNVIEVDGHDMEALVEVIDTFPSADSDIPTVIIGSTIKGHGISFMENQPGWHAGMISDELLVQAKNEIQQVFEQRWGA